MAFSPWSCFSILFKVFSFTGALGNLRIDYISDYSGYKLAKFYALPFNKSISISVVAFNLVHYDVWRPSLVTAKGGYAHYYQVFLMKRASTSLVFHSFGALVKIQHSAIIKFFFM